MNYSFAKVYDISSSNVDTTPIFHKQPFEFRNRWYNEGVYF